MASWDLLQTIFGGPMADISLKFIEASLASAAASLDKLRRDGPMLRMIASAATLLTEILKAGGKVYSCGNGGSMCDAMHFAEELSGRFRRDRAGLAAMAISDPAHLTCAGNDFGFEKIFSRFIECHGRKGDLLLAISTSGSSPNILSAAIAAKAAGLHTIAMTGRENCKLGELADLHICTPGDSKYSDRIQELHIKVIHTLIELCEREMFPENYP
jgi:D-sedoheptulose 7-phosphate isomerase